MESQWNWLHGSSNKSTNQWTICKIITEGPGIELKNHEIGEWEGELQTRHTRPLIHSPDPASWRQLRMSYLVQALQILPPYNELTVQCFCFLPMFPSSLLLGISKIRLFPCRWRSQDRKWRSCCPYSTHQHSQRVTYCWQQALSRKIPRQLRSWI